MFGNKTSNLGRSAVNPEPIPIATTFRVSKYPDVKTNVATTASKAFLIIQGLKSKRKCR